MTSRHNAKKAPSNATASTPNGDHLLDGLRMTISDGQGGILQLDLSQPGLDELTRACDALLTGKLPSGACLMRVWAGDDTYLLRRVKHSPASIGITRLGAQTQEISLAEDVLQLVTRVIEQTRMLRPPANESSRRRSED